LTFVYSDSTAVVGPLATAPEPHSWDLCVAHAGRITAPRGWELVRHAGPLPSSPDEDDLVALADAVRESRGGRESVVMGGLGSAAFDAFADPAAGAPGGPNGTPVGANGANATVLAPPPRQSATAGRRRGHLRVLPDPPQ
jgi:acetylornithine deacetylase/succinyl-diaminopimelate desuccinylase-like protein